MRLHFDHAGSGLDRCAIAAWPDTCVGETRLASGSRLLKRIPAGAFQIGPLVDQHAGIGLTIATSETTTAKFAGDRRSDLGLCRREDQRRNARRCHRRAAAQAIGADRFEAPGGPGSGSRGVALRVIAGEDNRWACRRDQSRAMRACQIMARALYTKQQQAKDPAVIVRPATGFTFLRGSP